jgi:hypothetical protein
MEKLFTASRDALGWFAYVNGEMLRNKIGVGRRFHTEDKALAAAKKAAQKDTQ